MDRLATDPAIHIYHYAPYEPTAVGRLMGRHATREEEVDRLLRGDVFVDLFRAVRQGLRASVESYSIKKLEPLYGLDARGGPARRRLEHRRLRDAGWPSRRPDRRAAAIARTDPIAAEHRGLQPRRLRLQLAAARLAGGAARRSWRHGSASRCRGPRPGEPEPPAELSERLAHVAEVADRLCAGVPDGPGGADAGAARPLAAGPAAELAPARGEVVLVALLPPDGRPHGRRADRRARADRRLRVRAAGSARSTARSSTATASRSRSTRSTSGRDVRDPATGSSPGSVVAIDEARRHDRPEARPEDGRPASHVARAVRPRRTRRRCRRACCGSASGSPSTASTGRRPYAAARELLMRRPPRIAGGAAALPRRRGRRSRRPLRVAPQLDRQLPGGPGAARLGQDLPRRGGRGRTGPARAAGSASRRTATGSSATCSTRSRARAGERGVAVRIGQKTDRSGDCTSDAAEPFGDYGRLLAALAGGEVDVVGGTAWLWSRPEFAGAAGRPRRGRGRPAVARQRRRGLAGRSKPRPARRPAAARPAAPGHASARRRGLGPGSRPGRRVDHAAGPRPLPGRGPGGSTRTCAGSPRRPSTRAASRPRRGWRAQDLDGQRHAHRHRACASFRSTTTATATSRRRRRRLVAGLVGELVDGRRRRGRTRDGAVHRIGWDDVLVVAPYNAQVAEVARRPAAGPRRHRRQVPGPGGAGLDLLHGHLHAGGRAARHGVPLQPEPPQRGHVAGPLPGRLSSPARLSSASVPERLARCTSPTPCAAFWSLPPAEKSPG